MARVTAKVEGLMVNPLSPRKGLLDHKEELQEPDAEPSRQLSSHSSLSEDLHLELDEVKRQLSQAQDAAFEAISRAKTAEEKMAKEVQEQEERKASARRLLEESQRKRRFQEAKAKAEALEVPAKKGQGPAPSTLTVPRPGGRPSGKVSAQSPKGIRTVFKVKREVSRQRQDEFQAVKLAAEQRKKDLDAILKQEENERESFGTLKARLSSAEACKQLLQVQLANMAAKAERLAFEREDLLCRLAISSEAKAPVPTKPSRRVSERTLRRLRRTTGFTFVVIMCMALFAYIKAFHLIEIGPQGAVDVRPKPSHARSEGGRSTCWLRR